MQTGIQQDLASIIIPCCNQLDFTRVCLDSLGRTTRSPFELILINNGSSDGTAAYLDAVAKVGMPGLVQTRLLTNSSNLGYAKAINQGLRIAEGEYVVLLNNDTFLTPYWLDLLIECLNGFDGSIGMVGPVSNYVPPSQLVQPEYATLEGLLPFAEKRRTAFRGQGKFTERLSGFCLLLRHQVLQRIGFLDERFETGFFEDDDLCFRAVDAGYRLAIALDVYIHHFGSQTFRGLGVNTEQQLRQNFSQFRDKWGTARTAGYRMADGSPPDMVSSPPLDPQKQFETPSITTSGTKQRVSLCMIVKNEEQHLPGCLESVHEIVDEIVIVDTGSTDQTKAVALKYGAKVIDFPWIDHFAAARNISIENATGDWIFWMDADDRLDASNREALHQVFQQLPDATQPVGFVLKCLCFNDKQRESKVAVDHIRLFPRHPELRWRYRIHEQILPSLRQLGGDTQWVPVTIEHIGYQDSTIRKKKLERDIRLLHMEHQDNPDDPFTLFNLGSVLLEMGDTSNALTHLEGSLARSGPSDSIVRKLYALLITTHRQLGDNGKALQVCQIGRKLYPQDSELLFHEALLHREKGDLASAVRCLELLTQSKEHAHFASVDPSLREIKGRHNLAVAYRDLGRLPEARAQWKHLLNHEPDFLDAWLGLAELSLQDTGDEEFARLLAAIDKLDPAGYEAHVLRARRHLFKREFQHAKDILMPLCQKNTQSIRPRIIMSHVYLQEGSAWVEARQMLEEVLALDPSNREAQHNLRVLQLQHENKN